VTTCLQNYKVYSIEMKDIQQCARLVTFLVVSRQHSRKTTPELSSNNFTFFKYAPITFCDVERSFSRYKTMLSDNRRSFLFENFTMCVIVYCDYKNDSED
jgi:hypothetical protein